MSKNEDLEVSSYINRHEVSRVSVRSAALAVIVAFVLGLILGLLGS